MKNTNKTLSIYCHFPWCKQKCPYCDFNSFTQKKTDSEDAYIQALCQDLSFSCNIAKNKTIQSIFFGGGTPSLFKEKNINKVLNHIYKHFSLHTECEITIEMNPHSASKQKLKSYLKSGINRLSIGVQSFNNTSLKKLGRIHCKQDAINTFYTSREIGFKNINIDIMHSLPEQSLNMSIEDLQQTIQLKPEHISWYELTLEPNTYFAKYPPKIPHEELKEQIYFAGIEILQAHGFNQYEISAYSKTKKTQCIHNKNYWQFGDYIGCGNGSCSKISNLENSEIIRYYKHKSPKAYQLAPCSNINKYYLNTKEIIFEYFLNRSRLTSIISEKEMINKTGLSFKSIQKQIEIGKKQKLIQVQDSNIRITTHGFKFLNDFQELFLD